MATIHWVGGAAPTVDLWTATVANTWATNDLLNLDFGIYRLQLTIGGTATTAEVALQAVNMINALSAAGDGSTEDPLPGAGYVRNFGGKEIVPFRELEAELTAVGASTFYIRALAAGNALPLTASESTAGSGTFAIVNTTPATGPTFANNADNYVEGTIPADNDTIRFDRGATNFSDGLTYFKTNNIDLNWSFSNDWTGVAGRPAMNPNGYAEQRQTWVQCRGGGLTMTLEAGVLGNVSGGKLWLDFTDQTGVKFNILAARNSNLGEPSVYIAGTDAATGQGGVTVKAGRVIFEPSDSPASTAKAFFASSWNIGRPGGGAEPIIELGPNVRQTVAATTAFRQWSGAVYNDNALYATGSGNYTSVEINGGEFVQTKAADVHSFAVENGGKLSFRTPGGSDLTVGDVIRVQQGGTLDLSGCPDLAEGAGCTIALYAGSTFEYPSHNGLTIWEYRGCSPDDVGGTLPQNVQATMVPL